MAGTLTITGDQRCLDWLFTTGSPTRPTSWFVALHVGANDGTGASNELSGNGYARQAVTFTRVGQTMSNTSLITFGPNLSIDWGTVTDMTVWDLATGGNCLAQGTATTSVLYAVGDSATVAIGALTISLA